MVITGDAPGGQSFKQYSQVLDLEDKAEWLGQGPGRRKIGG